MKLKKWLTLSHLILMLTPLISGVLLFMIINHYNHNKDVMDYISIIEKFRVYEEVLNNPDLYKGMVQQDLDIISEREMYNASIELYNIYGQQIYTSSNNQITMFALSEENLYSNLYKIQTGTKAYTLKKPVFKDGEIVGFYKISISREDFIKGINYRTIMIFLSFIAVILTVFIFVINLLNRKLNKPIKLLVKGMNDFADGKESTVYYEAKDEIGEIIFHFNKMKSNIEEQRMIINEEQQSKDYMISAISHDIKTPLTAIRAYAETMVEDEEGELENIKEKSKVIINKSDYIKMMIDDLMMYNLLSKKYDMNFIELEGNEFFEMLFSGYEEACSRKQIKLSVDISVQGNYRADVNQMTRVVDNLMTNALRHTNEHGEIYLGAFSLNEKFPIWFHRDFIEEIKLWKDNGLIIIVQNQGNAISDSEKSKIFKPFYQSDDSRSKIKWNGVGLGLSIVNLVIDKHEGEIKVISRENNTAFICWIPN